MTWERGKNPDFRCLGFRFAVFEVFDELRLERAVGTVSQVLSRKLGGYSFFANGLLGNSEQNYESEKGAHLRDLDIYL